MPRWVYSVDSLGARLPLSPISVRLLMADDVIRPCRLSCAVGQWQRVCHLASTSDAPTAAPVASTVAAADAPTLMLHHPPVLSAVPPSVASAVVPPMLYRPSVGPPAAGRWSRGWGWGEEGARVPAVLFTPYHYDAQRTRPLASGTSLWHLLPPMSRPLPR